MALTFPPRDAFYPAPPATLGNILVEAPNGNVIANAAGILQIPLNGLNYPDAVTTVLAGYQLNSSGEPEFALGSQNSRDLRFDNSTAGHGPGGRFVTQLLDADGLPVLDVNGRQIYVENLGAKGGQMITFSVAGGKVAITPYLDAGGYPVSVASLAGTDDWPRRAIVRCRPKH